MPKRKLFQKHPKYPVAAVQLDLEFDNFSYQKWNGVQTCKQGDWLVYNDGDVYTVDKKYFRDYYQQVSHGVFKKIGDIWAEVATKSGSIQTKEGSTAYNAGDYLVFDRQEGGDGYAIKKHIFEKMYEQVNETLNLTTEQKSYIDNRIISKINDYAIKATRNKHLFYIGQILAIVTAALIPVFTGVISDSAISLKWTVAGLGGASAVFASLLSLFNFQQNWVRSQNTSQDLESHIAQFKTRASIYWDKISAFDLLVENCERILNAERGQWAEKSKQDVDQSENS
jgi:hypothetical protein